MSARHRVIWSQGLFLQPQHFQQQARFFEHMLDARLRAAAPHAWAMPNSCLMKRSWPRVVLR